MDLNRGKGYNMKKEDKIEMINWMIKYQDLERALLDFRKHKEMDHKAWVSRIKYDEPIPPSILKMLKETTENMLKDLKEKASELKEQGIKGTVIDEILVETIT